MDTTAEQEDWDEAFALITGDDAAMPVLRLDGGARDLEPLLSVANIPYTGFGS